MSTKDLERVGSTKRADGQNKMSSSTSGRLCQPFKCPASAVPDRKTERPSGKRRKICYEEPEGADGKWTNKDRLALANRDVNKYPVYQAKDKDALFRRRFSVPFLNGGLAGNDQTRPAPTLGIRRGAAFMAKPLYDPCGDFAIVLFDPTVDQRRPLPASAETHTSERSQLTVPLMHKSLAEILGIKKEVDKERPKVPVVIDPKLARVLRPHQVEGVKVRDWRVQG